MKFLKKLFKKYFSNEVIQLFINENGIETRLGLINFPSFFDPTLAKKRQVLITARDANGKKIATKKVQLNAFGSAGINVKELFPEITAAFGTISAKLCLDKKVKKILKNTTMHFYVFYSDNKGSTALIHPQSKIGDQGTKHWESNATFDSSKIKKFVFFQINPSLQNVKNNIKISERNSKKEIASIENHLDALSVIKNEFTPIGKEIFISTDVIHNSKPLTFIYFNDDTFTAIHS